MTNMRTASLWTDVGTVLWKEWREVFNPLKGGAGRSGWLSMALSVAVFGIFLPLQSGRAWVESPQMLVYWAWVPLFLVSGVVADAFAGERERHTLETLLASRLSDTAILLGKLAAAISYGCLLTFAGLAVGAVTVSVAHGHGRFLFYPLLVVVGGVALCLLGAGLAASAGVLVSLRAPTVRQAAQTLSLGTMALIFVPIFGLQALPAGIKAAVAARLATLDARAALALALLVLAVLDGALLAAARLRFQRAKLAVE